MSSLKTPYLSFFYCLLAVKRQFCSFSSSCRHCRSDWPVAVKNQTKAKNWTHEFSRQNYMDHVDCCYATPVMWGDTIFQKKWSKYLATYLQIWVKLNPFRHIQNRIWIITFHCTKGQLISKCLFGVIVLTKIATKILLGYLPWIFCSFLRALWKLFWAICRLPFLCPKNFRAEIQK